MTPTVIARGGSLPVTRRGGFFVVSGHGETMIQTLLIFLGGGLGAAARHGVNVTAARWLGTGFPWGTLTVNVVGSLAMGLFAAWFAFRADAGLTQHARLFLTTGILGGFTTFSAFSLDAAVMWERDAFM